MCSDWIVLKFYGSFIFSLFLQRVYQKSQIFTHNFETYCNMNTIGLCGLPMS